MMTVQLKSETTTSIPIVILPSIVAFSMANLKALARRGVKVKGSIIRSIMATCGCHVRDFARTLGKPDDEPMAGPLLFGHDGPVTGLCFSATRGRGRRRLARLRTAEISVRSLACGASPLGWRHAKTPFEQTVEHAQMPVTTSGRHGHHARIRLPNEPAGLEQARLSLAGP